MMEVNPPECRLIDMGSHNGTFVNGEKIFTADLKDGDQIRAGHTILRVKVDRSDTGVTSSMESEPALGLPIIPGYLLERELGRGAMGATYLGRRGGESALLAVKVVKPSFQGTPQQIGDFLRSARALCVLDHPHLVRLREVGGCPSGFYFVSDFVPGLDAGQILKREGPLPIARTLRWADHVLQALEYAHGKHFMHHDIKPTNVIITDIDGQEVARLADFAVARVYQNASFSGLSLTTGLLDLASFVPPEILFNYQESNPLSDQYSVAAVIYHLLTGAPVLDLPKEERKKFSTLLRRQYVPIRERRSNVPEALADVIERALSRTPSKRFADIAAFRQALLRSA